MRQFLSYFGVGGVSAIVEWAVFSFLIYFFNTPYMFAATFSFVVSTTTNWYLGKKLTFKESKAYQGKTSKEVFLVFFVSAIGLGFNLILMYWFVDILGMASNMLKTVAKIVSTGIVFMWNYLSRKLWVYKN